MAGSCVSVSTPSPSDGASERNFSYHRIADGQTITVPSGQQMFLYDRELVVEGTGELVIEGDGEVASITITR